MAREKDDPNELFIVLDRTKEQLKNAPAFEQGSWPESADQYWNRVEEFFGANEQETEVEIERE